MTTSTARRRWRSRSLWGVAALLAVLLILGLVWRGGHRPAADPMVEGQRLNAWFDTVTNLSSSAAAQVSLDVFRKHREVALPFLLDTMGTPDPLSTRIAGKLDKFLPGAWLRPWQAASRRQERLCAAWILVRLEPIPPEAVPALTRAVASGEGPLGFVAAGGLGKIGAAAEPCIPVLLQQMPPWALDSVFHIQSDIWNKEQRHSETLVRAIPRLRALYAGGSAGEQGKVFDVLGLLGTNAWAALPELKLGLQHSNATTRALAILVFFHMGTADAESLRLIMNCATYPDKPVREACARTLPVVGRGNPELAVLLGQSLNDTEPLVRQTAAQSLLELGVDATPALDGIVAGLERWKEDSKMARILCRCLLKLGPAAGTAGPLLEELRRIHPNLREVEEAWRALQRAQPVSTFEEGVGPHF